MKKLTILVDIDDTIEDLLGAWCDWLNKKYGTSFNKNDITEWDLSIKFAPLTREQIFSPLRLGEFWKTVQQKPNALHILCNLISDGHDVYFVTATDYTTIYPKYEYMIKRLFPFITWDNIIIANNKQMIHGDIIIDDGLHNLLGDNDNKVKLLMDAPHNRGFDESVFGIQRVRSWMEIYEVIRDLAEAE